MKTAIAVVAVALTTTAFTPAKAETFRVPNDVSGGHMKMRDGPGANHGLIGAIPAGETVNASRCVPRDDRIPGADWCLVYYRGMTGWVSQAGLMPVNVGTWTAPPRPAPTPAPSNADLHFSLICGAPRMMGGGPDPDPVLSVAVSWTAGRWSVTHTTLRGNVYNREAQYAMADNSDDRVARWSGTRIKNGNNYYMMGEATYTRSGQYVYRETLYANGRLDMKSEAICQPEPPVVARGGGGWDEALRHQHQSSTQCRCIRPKVAAVISSTC
jgi:hypothetical protein